MAVSMKGTGSASGALPPLTNVQTEPSNRSKIQKQPTKFGRSTSVKLAPAKPKLTISSHNSFQQRSRLQCKNGKSPVSLSPDDSIKFDYNVFLSTWQDQIKMRQYEKCEKYCREVIEKLVIAQQELQMTLDRKEQPYSTKSIKFSDEEELREDAEDPMHSLLEYRSKVHFSLAYLLKKYFKRKDEAREQYEKSIQTDKENPGAHFNLANMLVDSYRDYETAQTHFERAIALEPTYALYRMTFAEFLWHDLKLYELAAAQYEELIANAETQQNEDVFFNYGLLLRDHLDDLDKAMTQFERVLQINPNDTDAKAEYEYTIQLRDEERDEVVPPQPTSSPKQQQLQTSTVSHVSDSTPIGDAVVDKILDLKMESSESKQNENNNNNNNLSPLSQAKKPQLTNRRGSFRRSQHEIALGKLMLDDTKDSKDHDLNYALLYHQTLDEKGKLQMLLNQKQSREQAMTDNLVRVKEMMNSNDFRNELSTLTQNGVEYVGSHANEAYRILTICSKIVNELLSFIKCMKEN